MSNLSYYYNNKSIPQISFLIISQHNIFVLFIFFKFTNQSININEKKINNLG